MLGFCNPPHQGHGEPAKPGLLYPLVLIPCCGTVSEKPGSQSRVGNIASDLESSLVLDMIEILPPLGKYKYDTWRILPVKCYTDNSKRLRSYKRNVNTCLLMPLSLSVMVAVP
jgi:hypothetical protein